MLGATASRPTAKIVITAMTANNVIPLSDGLMLIVAIVLVVDVLLFGHFLRSRHHCRRIRLPRLEPLNVVRNARYVAGCDTTAARIEWNAPKIVRLAALACCPA